MNPGRLGAAAQWSSFPSSSGSQIVQDRPSACDSTNCAMFARTSDRGEPAKINFCRLRMDSVENSPNSCSDGASRDSTFAGNCIALSMNCPPGPIRFEKSRYVFSQADFIEPTPGRVRHYFKPPRGKIVILPLYLSACDRRAEIR